MNQLKKASGLALVLSLAVTAQALPRKPLSDVGPLSLKVYEPQTLQSNAEAFRIESFGNLPFKLSVSNSPRTHIFVEGPLANNGDSTQPGQGPLYQDDGQQSELQTVLRDPGVYRVVIESKKDAVVTSQCLDEMRCARPQMSSQDFLTKLRDKKVNGRSELDTMATMIRNHIDQYVTDAGARVHLKAELQLLLWMIRPGVKLAYKHFVDTTKFQEALHFPMLNIRDLPYLRPLSEKFHAAPKPAEPPLVGDLRDMLKNEGRGRSFPGQSTDIPDLQNGTFPNLAMNKDQVAQAHVMARVLTALALHNGSRVTLDGKVFTEPQDLISALIDSGHTVVARNERAFADFIDFSSHGVSVRWPVWIKINTKLPDGKDIVTPMGHSQFAWDISGPLINTKLKYYYGTNGALFYPFDETRMPWSGLRSVYVRSSRQYHDEVLKTFAIAGAYIRRIRSEVQSVAKGRILGGYGYLGVCNDSVGVIEYLTEGTFTSFPFGRAPELDQEAPLLHDGLDDVVRRLPHDIDNPPSAQDLYKRLYTDLPFPSPWSERVPSPELAGQFVEPSFGHEMAEIGRALGAVVDTVEASGN